MSSELAFRPMTPFYRFRFVLRMTPDARVPSRQGAMLYALLTPAFHVGMSLAFGKTRKWLVESDRRHFFARSYE